MAPSASSEEAPVVLADAAEVISAEIDAPLDEQEALLVEDLLEEEADEEESCVKWLERWHSIAFAAAHRPSYCGGPVSGSVFAYGFFFLNFIVLLPQLHGPGR